MLAVVHIFTRFFYLPDAFSLKSSLVFFPLSSIEITIWANINTIILARDDNMAAMITKLRTKD